MIIKVFRSQSGMSLLLPVVVIGLIIMTFMAAIAKMYISLNENNQKLLRGIAAIQVMQDFAVLGLQANDLSVSSAPGACPAGTTLVGAATGPSGFCWRNPTCIAHPLQNLAANRQICLTPVVGGASDANFAMTIEDVESPSLVAQWKEKSYQLLKYFLYSSSNEAIAQAVGRDIDLPNIAGNPVNSVTSNLTCVNPPLPLAAGSQLCKRCEGTDVAGLVNVLCTRIRVCLLNTPCAAGNNDNWVLQRFGILTRSN